MGNKFLYRFFLMSATGLFCLLSFLPVLAAEDEDQTPAAAGQAKTISDGSYLLQSGDRIHIKIYPEDEYIKGGEMQISSDGNITLPLMGKAQIGGKTIQEAEKEISKTLDADYLVNPEVVIEVLSYKELSVVVLGQVKKPGTYPFSPGSAKLTLLEAISMAGGFSDIANIKKIKIVRKNAEKKEVISANAESIISGKDPDPELEAGDVVHVSESLF